MKVSIVATTFNRALQCKRGLMSIINQDNLPKDMEIVLVDDGSTDNTKDVARELKYEANQKGIIFVYIYLNHPEHRISSIPRNIGFKNSLGEIVIFTESECLHVGNTIDQILKKMEEEPDRVPVATQLWTMGRRIWETLDEYSFAHPQIIIEHQYSQLVNGDMQNTKAPDSDWGITGSQNCFTGCLFAVRREWVEEVGGFDEEFEGHGWDDWDLMHRLDKYGKGHLNCNDIIAIHQWHEKNYPYNIYEASERNGKKSEARLNSGEFKANIGKEWGKI